MIKNNLFRLIILSAMLYSGSAQALPSPSREMVQSSLCNRYFPIYERKYHMPSNMLRAISVTESGRYSKQNNRVMAWPWTINVAGKGYYFNSKLEAIEAVRKFQAQGEKSIDVGCMQINMKYHPDAFVSLNQAFEPRYNVAYAAHMLGQTYKDKGSWETAIRHYHNVNRIYSDKYIARVYTAWRKEDKAITVARLERPSMFMSIRSQPKRNDSESDVSDITQRVLERFVE